MFNVNIIKIPVSLDIDIIILEELKQCGFWKGIEEIND